MLYSWLLIVHLLAAMAFIGTLFFEVVIWHRAREELAWSAQFTSDHAIARRSRQVLHGVVVLVYGAGLGLAPLGGRPARQARLHPSPDGCSPGC